MKIRIPTKIKFKVEKKYVILVSILVVFAVLYFGSAGLIREWNNQRLIEQRTQECVAFTEFLNTEVLPITTANVTDCECTYSPILVEDSMGTSTGNCMCSCKLYDENGTLIDSDWNPLFSTV